ncbi:sorting and assembly machinery component 50 homolog A isoform X3 [Micropterus dolomieu]|uniref:sorting and assembly machinery component 50 homolog A isoform X3 n=1 Tax=Micropterus dolomieu TaxID=147949 RepID=UPI001E8DED6E|nr:sorting and assembly machinery component 50 homolog A isoform X3 [Micropterus dolomieu]
MATQRENDAADYLKKHKIIELMDNLTSMLFFYRPENPREFLIEQLEQLKISQQSGMRGPNLFNNANLNAVFGILDPANQKYITFAQYKQALTTLGIKDINECPEGVNEDRISHETFKTEAMQGLQRCSATAVVLNAQQQRAWPGSDMAASLYRASSTFSGYFCGEGKGPYCTFNKAQTFSSVTRHCTTSLLNQSLDPLPMRGPELGVQADDIEAPETELEPKHEVLENKDVVVQRVHIDGLGRTKEDLLTYEIAGVFQAKNLIDVMRKSHEARQKLLRLGIFRKVEVVIDTSRGENALPNGLDVTFEVTELRRMTGSYNTMVGNNEGSMVLGLKLPNVLGRAEKLTFQFSYGTKETSYGLSFFKPQPGHFERNISLNIYKVTGQFPWSSLRETDRGISAELSFPVWKTSQTLKWEGVWRELGCLARTASFAVREESGHSLKSSLSHAMVIDTRNSSILPRKGGLLKIHQELAGYTGGDASFLKEDFEIQLNKTLFWDSVLSASLWGGLLLPIGDRPTSIADRFYLGGPTSIRGFSMYSMGPQSEGDYLGGEGYWAGGLHLYTPLPFRPGKGGFGDLFRTHFFLNAGNLCNLNYGEGPQAHLRKLAECIRWSYGLGIVLRLGNIARLELNYCIPMGVQSGDRICDGVQFGAGIRFL